MKWFTFFIFLVGISACTNADLTDKRDSLSEVNQRISAVLSRSTPCESIDNCDTVTVGFESKTASPKSHGQRILVIDIGMILPAYTRYKSRVLDFLALDEQGNFQPSKEEIRIPRSVFTVLSEILDEQYPSTTAHHLNPVADLFVKHKKVLNVLVEHGDVTFATLADLNPEAEFVIAELGSNPRNDLCTANEDPAAFERSRVFIYNNAASLKSIIEKRKINFVNMSFGVSHSTIRDTWNSNCPGKLIPSDEFFRRYHEMYFQNFYQTLFDLDDVIFVQAAAYSTRELKELDTEFFTDCQPVANRIRVGGFSSMESGLPVLGGEAEHLLSPSIKGALDCTDIAINFGISPTRPYEEGPYPVMTTVIGVGADSLGTRPSSSSAAPIALSYINYLKQSGIVPGEGAVFVDNFKKYHQGKFVEPARYRQFEIYRLGRL